MKLRTKRLAAIRQLISHSRVSSQEELLLLLIKEGYQTTQATLSRDLKYLKVAKVPDVDKGYKYVIPDQMLKSEEENVNDDFPVGGVINIEFSGLFGVLRTRPGFANSIASVIDGHGSFEILATIAGDDTILLINREGVSKSDILNALCLFIPDIKDKVV